MKNLMLSTALLAILAGSAVAQTATTEGAATTSTATDTALATAPGPGDLFRAAPSATDVLASDFIGMRLYASEAALGTEAYEGLQDSWTDIGEVNDLILGQDGTVHAVLIDIGGFLGLGERQVAVQMPSIRFVQDAATADNDGDFFLVLMASRATLEGAPIYGPDRGVEGMIPGAAATDTGGALRAPILRDGYAAVERDALTSKTLTGAEVYDAQDKRIGDVSELVLTPDGQVSDAVLDVGGFLGIGSKRVALPIADVDILQSQEGGKVRVYVPHTREQLEAMSGYEG